VDSSPQSTRVLIHAPYGRDGSLIQKELQKAGFLATVCDSVEGLCQAMSEGAAAALIADETLHPSTIGCLADQLASQPKWSDFPLLVLTSGGASTPASRYRLALLRPLGNVTLLERPLRPVTLVSSVDAALRSRRHQYQLCEHLGRIESSEQALRQSEARFRFLCELGDALRAVSDPESATAVVTQRLAEHLQASRCVYGQTESGSQNLSIWHDQAALQAGRTVVIRDVDRDVTTAAGRELFTSRGVQASICCPLVKNENLVATLSVHQAEPRDWTLDEVELVEEVLQRCWSSLERERLINEIALNNDILQRTNQDLMRANRELEEFAYVASHDLQEPLRMVNIYTQLILKRLGESADEEMVQFGNLLRQGAGRMEELLRDLLTFSRAVHAESPDIGVADLSTSLDEALSVLRNRIDESDAVVHAQPLPVVKGDARQLAHVFQNLISNSIKYRKTSEPPRICISSAQQDGQWIVAVQDNGIGFEQCYAERIFGLFKRLHKDEYPGTGLGLAICQRIVERYGGRMWATGKPGEGSTFYFSLLP
jgi:signal transduction histidine kinase